MSSIQCSFTAMNNIDNATIKHLCQYDRPRVLGCEPVDGGNGLMLSSNLLNIATFVHQMGDVCYASGEQKWQYLFDLNNQYPIY